MRPVFCGNFEYDAREGDLQRLFRKYGRVERVDMKAGLFGCYRVKEEVFVSEILFDSYYRKERVASPDYRRDDRRREKVASAENGVARDRSPRNRRGVSRSPPLYEKMRKRSRSRSKSSPENGQVESPGPIMEEEAGRGYDGAESPIRESQSRSPPAEE